MIGIQYEVDKMQILIYQFFLGIDYQDYNVSVFNCFQCFDDGEFFNGFMDIFVVMYFGGVDQGVFMFLLFIGDIDVVLGGIGYVIDYDLIFFQYLVDQGGFVNVWMVYYVNLDVWVMIYIVCFVVFFI